MSNIDKDINYLKRQIETSKKQFEEIGVGCLSSKEIEAIENVLKELEKEKTKNLELNIELKTFKQSNKNLLAKKQKLETYKKIAEKLALTILEIDVEEKDVYETICKSTPNNRCEEFGNGNCTQCIIDWARKEVEKDVKD